jgi:inner membrane transporter RhtA
MDLRWSERLPPHLYFVGSAVFHYLGPSFAVLLFARVSVGGVVWLRIVSAGLVFALWRRPWRAFLITDSRTRWLVAVLGALLAVMNFVFYLAIDRLPLGTVAAIEFVGPILLALVGVRSLRNLAALGLAVWGVYLLADVRLADEPLGFLLAFLNASLFTLYIVLAHRVSRADTFAKPVDLLGAAMLIAAVLITPVGLPGAIPVLGDPMLVLVGVGVGLSSSVIPYAFDQMAMSRLPRATYALFVALLPATAVIVGLIVLRQVPLSSDVAAVGLIIGGIVVHRSTKGTS